MDTRENSVFLRGAKAKSVYPYNSGSSEGSSSSGNHAAESTDLLAQSPTSPQEPEALEDRPALMTSSDRRSGRTISSGSTAIRNGPMTAATGPRKPWSRPNSTRYAPTTMSEDSSSRLQSNNFDLYSEHDPGRWNTDQKEDDDNLHDPKLQYRGSGCFFVSKRACVNVGTLVLLTTTLLALFMGYPLMTRFYFTRPGNKGGFNVGGTNASGMIPDLASLGIRAGLIDVDTPQEARISTKRGLNDDEEWNLVFSDEFNTNGRSFYPGEDPFWEAHNLWAHGTVDYEWYDPAAITTKDGALVITASEQALKNLNFRSGQLTSWNQFCFTGGYMEAAVVLPGDPHVSGWWPAIWTMGNLGRANYGATTDGMWPYAYDTCDRGTLMDQTDPDGSGPRSVFVTGAETGFNKIYHTSSLSWAPGQKLSSCTCDGEDHPGPKKAGGDYVGRSAPEIDLFEAQVDANTGGSLSLSGQWMPASAGYRLKNGTGKEYELYNIHDKDVTINSYRGNVYQMSASAIAHTDPDTYELTGNKFAVFGIEYEPGPDGYISWWIDGNRAWTIHAAAMGPDEEAGVGQRPIPEEPMYIIMNLAISRGFGYVNWDKLTFPAHLKVDYIRLYQAPGKENIGCDPKKFPTKDYIDRHILAYTNPNLTVWGGYQEVGGYGQIWPKNRLYGCNEEPRNYAGPLRGGGYDEAPVSASKNIPIESDNN